MRASLNYTSETPVDLVSACTLSRIRQTPPASPIKRSILLHGWDKAKPQIYMLTNREKVTLANK